MYARVSTFQIQPGKLDEGVRLFEETLAPVIKGQQGFVSALLLTDRATNKATMVTLWETLDDLNASEALREQQIANSQVAALLAGAPGREVFEVAVRVG
jgi:heme-degrading monooxygenase HmoA